MIVADVNLMVAAFRGDHPTHESARRFLTSALSGGGVTAPDLVWVGFFRLVTNRRIFPVPARFDEAVAFARAVTESPGYRPVAGLSDGLERFYAVTSHSYATDNLVPDAYIASVALSLGCPVATFDRDFHRFDDLTVVDPRHG